MKSMALFSPKTMSGSLGAVTLLLCVTLTFGRSLTKITLPSSARPGHVVALLPRENSHYIISDSSNGDISRLFTVLHEGQLITTTDLSSFLGRNLNFHVKCKHENDPWHQVFSIDVVRPSDMHPHFVGQPFQGHLFENMPLGTPLNGLEDLYENLKNFDDFVDLSIVRGHKDFFNIQNLWPFAKPSIVNNAVLDRENKTKFHLTLRGLMKDGVEALASVFVDVKDTNDNIPMFEHDEYSATVNVNTDPATIIARVHATDADENDVVTYSAEKNDFVSVDPQTGDVMLKDGVRLQEKSYEFKIYATDNAGNKGSPAVFHLEAIDPVITVAMDSKSSHTRLRRATDEREDLTFVVTRTTTGQVFTVKNYNPSCTEMYDLSDAPSEVGIDANTGMVSILRQFNNSVTQVQFTVNITCSNDPAFADNQLVIMNIVDRGPYDPIFSNEPYPIKLRTSIWTRPYTPLITLQSIDAEMGVNVRYAIESDEFSNETDIDDPEKLAGAQNRFILNNETGELRTNGRMPFNCTSPFQVAISAQAVRAAPQNIRTPAQVIEVHCGNLAPQFNRPEYNITMDELTNPSTVVASMAAKSFYGLPLQYSIAPADGRPIEFRIDPNTGDVRPSRVLNRVNDPWRYVMTVTASEVDGQEQYSAITQLVINLRDINDNAPMFPVNVYVSTDVPENAGVGDQVMELTVIDNDSGNFGRVTFEVDNPLFAIEQDPDENGKMGTLVVNGSLDYDLLPTRMYEVTVTARDGGGLEGSATVQVWPVNVNDQAPALEPLKQRVWLKMSARNNTLVHVVQAYDLDGDNIRFRFNNRNPTQWEIFRLNPNTGEIHLTQDLQPSVQRESYTLPIIAEDDSSCCPGEPTNIGEGVVFVDFIVVNSPPAFPDCATYKPRFKEGQPVRTGVINVTAVDTDSGSNGELTYSLIYEDQEREVFGIREPSGQDVAEIFSNYVFNRSSPVDNHFLYGGDIVYPVTVQAEDNGRPRLSATCFFLITIEDINDHEPRFDSSVYNAKILNTAARGTRVVRVYAYDEDQGDNARVTYSFVTNTDAFGIDPDRGFITVIDISGLTQSVNLTVQAQDNGVPPLKSTSQVIIQVVTSALEMNPAWENVNNVPIDDLPAIEMPENTPVGFQIARDFIAGGTRTNGIYYYVPDLAIPMLNKNQDYIATGSDDNENAMVVEVSRSLDFETTPDYLLTLRASWRNTPGGQYADAHLKVRLTDVNDNPPRFIGLDSTGKFPAAAPENEKGPLLISVVFAIDLDGSEKYRNVEYFFKENCLAGDCQYFDINKDTGEIYSKEDVIFNREEKALYTLDVYALDGDSSMPMEDRLESIPREVPVQVIITGASMNPPYFENTQYEEDADPGLSLNNTIGEVRAVVPDPDMNYPQYGIIKGNEKRLFAVDSSTGRIYSVGYLMPEAPNDRIYTLTYRVFDGLQTNITTIVNVRLNDKNLFPPRFGSAIYEALGSIDEHSAVNGVILNATASDPETGVIGQTYAGSGNIYRPDIFTVRANGNRAEVLLSDAPDRDYPAGYANWQINLEARDSQGMTGYAVMNLRLDDINDNAPIFDTCCLTGHVEEHQPTGPFHQIFARDYDAGNNARITFSLPDQADRDYFAIDPNTGMISNVQAIDREVIDRFEITVQAQDNPDSGNINTVTQTVSIIVDDINDNPPIFQKRNYEISMPEQLPIDASVSWVKAEDADIGVNAQLTYSVVASQDGNYFYMDSIYAAGTGVIKMRQIVDYDAPGNIRTLNFDVQVQDPSSNDIASVTINVYDINDNAPVFDPPSQTVTVPEDAEVGREIATVTASDIDENENAQFSFYIDYENSDQLFNFEVNPDSGLITLKNRVDWATNNGQLLKILAIDEGTPPMTGTGTITITVQDVNNHAPMVQVPNEPIIVRRTYSGIETTIATLQIIDEDSPNNGPPFQFAADLSQCSQPYCQDLSYRINGNSLLIQNRKTTYNRDNFKSYIPVIPIQDTASSGSSLTGTSTLTVIIADTNAHAPEPGAKTITAYNYRGLYNDVFIGSVFVDEPDDWDKADKTYAFQGDNEGFELRDFGDLYMMSGATSKTLYVKVTDPVHNNKEVISTVQVNVIYIDDDAVKSSGSFRFQGTTDEEFVNNGNIDKLRTALSGVLETAEDNIEIFTLQQNPNDRNEVFVRYAAHGSPYYTSSRLNGRALRNKGEIENAIGLVMLQAPVDECVTAQCWDGGCTNELIINENEPLTVNGNRTSLVGVDAYIQAGCNCGARDFADVQPNPQVCRADSCLNGGTCRETWGDVVCACLEGFDGPRCQQLRHSFSGNGWAWYEPLETCREDVLSLEIATQTGEGLILYQGPLDDTQPGQLRDFIALELTGGYPRLRMNLGDGEVTLTVSGVPRLTDGQWHNIQVIREGMEVRLVVDYCRQERINETLRYTSSDRSTCEAKGTVPGNRFVLRGTNPLQLGGRSDSPNYPANILNTGFNGCMKNVRHNGVLYDLHIGEKGQHAQTTDGCPREDDQCDQACPTNSTCSAGLSTQRTCTCVPGWRGRSCDVETTSRKFVQDGGFMEWGLADDFNRTVLSSSNELQVMFRTRQENGVVFQASSFSKLEHIKLVLVNGRLNLLIDLGSDERALALNVNASDGRWHMARMMRQGNQVILSMDGGDGRYYAERLPAEEHRLLALSGRRLFGGANVEYRDNWVQAYVESTLLESCVNDIRYDSTYFPMTETEDDDITEINLSHYDGTELGCEATDVCANFDCPTTFTCVNAWLIPYCMCPAGHIIVGEECVRLMTCGEQPCQNGATCIDIPGVGVECQCPPGYSGEFCNAAPVVGLADGAIAGIVIGSLLFLLLLILLLIFLLRCRKKEPLLIEEPDDDIRENVVFYDEEGAGEEDMLAFDISRLQKPIDGDDISMQKKNMVFGDGPLRREERPLGLAAEPMAAPRYPQVGPDGKYPHIGDFIDDRMNDADYDPNAPPYDSVREYQYEGSNSINGSLSSLNSSSSASEQDYDYLNNWGPRFAKLAEMYGGGEDDDDDEDASSV